jgi:hypothetical protein
VTTAQIWWPTCKTSTVDVSSITGDSKGAGQVMQP